MKVLQIGTPRSGNLWLWKIIEEIGKRAGVERKRFITSHPAYDSLRSKGAIQSSYGDIDVLEITPWGSSFVFDIPQLVSVPIRSLDDYLRETWHVWTHSHWNENTPGVTARFDKVLYVVRDPRDALLSYSRFIFSPFLRSVRHPQAASSHDYVNRYLAAHAKEWVRHVGGYLIHAKDIPVHFVFYERLLSDLPGEVRAIIDFLGLKVAAGEEEAIAKELDFAAMNRQDPHHCSVGARNQWVKSFAPEECARYDGIAGDMIRILGYRLCRETDNNSDSIPLPSAPRTIPSALVSAAIQKASRKPIRSLVGRGLRAIWSGGL